jgi:hypothetical protein
MRSKRSSKRVTAKSSKPTAPSSLASPSTLPEPSEKSSLPSENSNIEPLKKRPAQSVADSPNKRSTSKRDISQSLEEKKEQLK